MPRPAIQGGIFVTWKSVILTARQRNEVEQFNGYGTQFRISYSHRLALSTDYNECTLRTLFDKADKYMYENKQQSKQGRQD